ncbi:MAG: Crp/Fnr family transcriptional regulator, partial [Mariprofundus sp.]
MEIEVAWIEENFLKTKLSDEQCQQLQGVVNAVAISKGKTIVKEGEKGGVLYFVRSGSVDIFQDLDGQEQRLTGLGEGSMIGEVTFLSGELATATVVAAADSVVYTMDRAGFARLMQHSHEMVFALFTYML